MYNKSTKTQKKVEKEIEKMVYLNVRKQKPCFYEETSKNEKEKRTIFNRKIVEKEQPNRFVQMKYRL